MNSYEHGNESSASVNAESLVSLVKENSLSARTVENMVQSRLFCWKF
jgi:hypothetical protein